MTRALLLRQVLAWGVHFYTSLGLVAAAGMAVCVVHGGDDAYRWAFVLMLAATLVDATDGTLARLVQVKRVLPGFDGRRLDDLTDFLTYTCLPLLVVWRARLVPERLEWVLFVPLLASAYGFCQVHAKTVDGYFLGFPSYWNLIAFYLYLLRLPRGVNLALIVVFAILTLVPTRYLYPTARSSLYRLTNFLAGIWTAMIVWILWDWPSGAEHDRPPIMTLISLFFPAYYLAASWVISWQHWRGERHSACSPAAAPSE